ncbi:MAG: hypothetical protein NW223_09130 [Hyphomicrobiaceae bacterium]|nr:hypothetical protein [Hyphomicrobiaceae bacterium]
MVHPVPMPPQPGYELFLTGETRAFGAVIAVAPALRIYVENAGEFDLPVDAVVGVHDEKVIIDPAKVDAALLRAVRHAHDAEDRD